MAAYYAYTRGPEEGGGLLGQQPPPGEFGRDHRQGREWKVAGARWSLHGLERAARGYFIIDVADLDAAISWAARCPTAGHGVVEVRPLWPTPA